MTFEIGTSVLVGLRFERILELPGLIDARVGATHRAPEGFDGYSTVRVADVLDFLTDARATALQLVALLTRLMEQTR